MQATDKKKTSRSPRVTPWDGRFVVGEVCNALVSLNGSGSAGLGNMTASVRHRNAPQPRHVARLQKQGWIAMRSFEHLSDMAGLVGQEIGVSEWITVDQARIDGFAEATGDRQWIHVDPERAAAGPFGTTIAHGFLTLSLLPEMGASAMQVNDTRMGVNYGLNRVRFTAPVPVGSRLRGVFKLRAFEPIAGGAQLTMEVTMQREGSDKPVCIAESLARRYT